MRIGIDVGGTNTDAVLMDGTDVLAEVTISAARCSNSALTGENTEEMATERTP